MLDRYLSRPEDAIFDIIKYCEYYEQYMVANTLPWTATMVWRDQIPGHQMYVYQRLRGEKNCRMSMLYPSSGEVFYMKLLLLHTIPSSFLLARTVDGTVHESFQAPTRALGLLDNDTEGELCFTKAVESGYFPAQLRCLLVTLVMDGACTSTGPPGKQPKQTTASCSGRIFVCCGDLRQIQPVIPGGSR